MQNQQGIYSNTINSLIAKNAVLENNLAEKNAVISDKELIILKKDSDLSYKDSTITKLNIELESAKFNYEQLRRMIFGSKKERFVSNVDFQQLSLEFEPKVVEIEEAVKQERELIRIEYLKKKPKKQHQGRLKLPKHLPVKEITIEPTEDTTGMLLIGEEITEE